MMSDLDLLYVYYKKKMEGSLNEEEAKMYEHLKSTSSVNPFFVEKLLKGKFEKDNLGKK